MISYEDKAEILVEALPYIQGYSGQIVVVKYGGSAMSDRALQDSVMRDVVLLKQVGVKVVVVHGGGNEISDTLSKMNLKTEFVGGLRRTDKQTMDVVQMVLAGKVNKDLVNLIENVGGKALGLSGVDGHMLLAKKVSEELGFVGEVTDVNTAPILDALELGYVPVISTIAYDRAGNVYNVNADDAAGQIAGALHAVCLVSLTDIKGIMANKDDENSLIPAISAEEAPVLIENGVVTGGMIPKVNCCVEAVRHGVHKVFIIDGKVPHSILIELFSDAGIGTMFHN